MRKVALAGLLFLLGAGLVATEPKPERALVDALDACVQNRFADPSPKRFGVTRIGERHNPEFVPETDAERTLVQRLVDAGWEVRFYLGGRGLIVPPDTDRDISWAVHIAGNRQTFNGVPLPINPKESPSRESFRAGARAAFASFEAGGSTAGFPVEEWQVAARPVRASSQRCVDCHNRADPRFELQGPIKIGDLLGVAMYAFRPAATAAPQRPISSK